MRRALASAFVMGALSVVGLAGCGEETTDKTVETVETPGGTTEVTTEKSVETTGDHTSGAAPTTTPAPAPAP